MSETRDVFICEAVRTPIGRYGGALARVRADDLAAVPIRALVKRHPRIEWSELDEVVLVAPTRRARTTATWPHAAPGRHPGLRPRVTGTGCAPHSQHAARAIRCGETQFAIAGG